MESDRVQDQSPEPIVTSDRGEVSPPFAAYVGINEAARLTGKGKQQIYRDVKAGRLSWHVAADGKKTLGIADLDRVYGLRRQDVTGNESGHQNRLLPAPVAAVTTETAVELAVLRERCARLEAENSDLRQTRDKLLDQNTRLTMLLPAPPAPAGNGSPPPRTLARPTRQAKPRKRSPRSRQERAAASGGGRGDGNRRRQSERGGHMLDPRNGPSFTPDGTAPSAALCLSRPK